MRDTEKKRANGAPVASPIGLKSCFDTKKESWWGPLGQLASQSVRWCRLVEQSWGRRQGSILQGKCSHVLGSSLQQVWRGNYLAGQESQDQYHSQVDSERRPPQPT
jgi:hypothetical protein